VLWLRSLAATAATLPKKYQLGGAHADWIEARTSALWWNEVGANWMITADTFRDLHQRHRDTSSADDIAWAAVETGLGGECEGYLPCYVERANLLEGEYLRRHPNGRRAGDAVERIGKAAAFWLTRIDRPDAFTPDKDCAEMTKALAPIRAAVAATTAAERQTTIEKLDRMNSRCGGTVEQSPAPPAPAATPVSTPATPVEARPVVSRGSPVGVVAGVLAAGVVGIAAMVLLRRRGAPPANRIGFS
jgi:hypothetical protein